MLIPIDRPMIDARNIREAATQTVTGDDQQLVHNHRASLRITLTGTSATHTVGSSIQAIQSGVRLGQRLRIMVVASGSNNYLVIVDNSATAKTVLRGNWKNSREETQTVGSSYLDVEWDGTYWSEVERYDGFGWNASGRSAHAEGGSGTASGEFSHVEGADCTATAIYAHAQGATSRASGVASHAEGLSAVADYWGEHAHSGGRFAADGDAQYIRFVGRKLITMSSAWQSIMYLDGSAQLLIIPANTLLNFTALVVGAESGLAARKTAYNVWLGAIWRDGANNTTLLTGVPVTVHEDDASYECQCIADDVNDALQIQIRDTDNTAVAVRWVVVVQGVMVSFP